MADIALNLICDPVTERQYIDIKVENGDVVGDDGLETAILISLFTHRRISEEELPTFETSKRGWWGDSISDVEGDQIGSRLWSIQRNKTTEEVRQLHEEFAEEALQWLIEDGVAETIVVAASYPEPQQILLDIQITKPTGLPEQYAVIWDGQQLKRA